MLRKPVLVAAALAIATSGRAAAQEFKFQPPSLFQQQKPAPKGPSVDWKGPPAAEEAAAKPAVVCGMTVVPADSKIDPGVAHTLKDSGVKYTLKVVQPTVCAPTHR